MNACSQPVKPTSTEATASKIEAAKKAYDNAGVVNPTLRYRKAAEHGNAKAQYALGHLYETGRGVKRNTELGKEWKSEAVTQGSHK